MTAQIKKDDLVCYELWFAPHRRIRARVLRVHRDGMVTVRSLFEMKPDGSDWGGYLGYTYRTAPINLTKIGVQQ
jgi:hypothetical protein